MMWVALLSEEIRYNSFAIQEWSTLLPCCVEFSPLSFFLSLFTISNHHFHSVSRTSQVFSFLVCISLGGDT
ncbi:hypothetical protein ACOSQ4_000966 [Xanthoceras sorbifolium]